MRWWKWVGLAGLVGAAAVGTAIVVQQRRRRTWTDYEPEELRQKLHERLRSTSSSGRAHSQPARDLSAAGIQPGV